MKTLEELDARVGKTSLTQLENVNRQTTTPQKTNLVIWVGSSLVSFVYAIWV